MNGKEQDKLFAGNKYKLSIEINYEDKLINVLEIFNTGALSGGS